MQLNYYFAIEVRHYQTYSLYNLKYLMGMVDHSLKQKEKGMRW